MTPHSIVASTHNPKPLIISSTEDTERRLAKWQVVVSRLTVSVQFTITHAVPIPTQDEKYHSLEKYQVNRRRIVFVASDQRRAGGYGIVRRAHLHPFAYLPTWFASSQYGPPQVVAVKEIQFSAMRDIADLKRVGSSLAPCVWVLTQSVIRPRPSRRRCWFGRVLKRIQESPNFSGFAPTSGAQRRG